MVDLRQFSVSPSKRKEKERKEKGLEEYSHSHGSLRLNYEQKKDLFRSKNKAHTGYSMRLHSVACMTIVLLFICFVLRCEHENECVNTTPFSTMF